MRLVSYISPKLPIYFVYMLQQVEYSPSKFIRWLIRLPNLFRVQSRQKLVYTKRALGLVLIGYVCLAAWLGILYIGFGWGGLAVGVISSALVLALIYEIFVFAAWVAFEKPRRIRLVKQARSRFSKTKATKIAILGSYGKTTMKEILFTVLSETKNVAMTPGNKNVVVSHAAWIRTISGNENILLIEYGEGAPGDIGRMARMSSPNMAVITGLAPNHLDQYNSLESVRDDLLSIRDFVEDQNIYSARELGLNTTNLFDEKGTKRVQITESKTNLDGTHFTVLIDGEKYKFSSGLVGEHLLGPLSVSIQIALDQGVDIKDIQNAVAKTKPFEHRLQPRNIGGAYIIDDTYNGSIEGFKAGLNLLKGIEAKRKIYVTPGLVDQGEETERVHKEIGKLISSSDVDKVILMKNSTTEFIKQGLSAGSFSGQLEVRDDPLEFYTNLEHTLAAGDVALLQNDWTDNYS